MIKSIILTQETNINIKINKKEQRKCLLETLKSGHFNRTPSFWSFQNEKRLSWAVKGVVSRLNLQVRTRCPDQCRSHHQKMVKHHNDIDGIISHLDHKLTHQAIEQSSIEEITIQEIKFQQYIPQNASNLKQKEFVMKEINEEDVHIPEDNLWNMINADVWVQPEQSQMEQYF